MPRPHRHPPRRLLDLPGTLKLCEAVRLRTRAVVDLPEVELGEVTRSRLQEDVVHPAQDLVAELVATLRDRHVGELVELAGAGPSDDGLGWAEAVAHTVPEGVACKVKDGWAG